VRFSGEHAECDLQGLYLAGDKQLIDYHMDVRHGLPNCTSRENFKGILYGKGKAVFDGLVYVAQGCAKDRCGHVQPQPDAVANAESTPSRSSRSTPTTSSAAMAPPARPPRR
jgi:hypothetical protein